MSGMLKKSEDLQPGMLRGNAETAGVGLLGSAALGGIAVSPFLGMIGEDPITKDPYTNKNIRRYSGRKLERLSRPGDVIVSTKPNWKRGLWKIPQSLSSGSDFYHSEPVFVPRGKRNTTITAGKFSDPSWGGSTSPSDIKSMKPHLRPIGSRFKNDELILLRPKTKMSPAQLEQLVKNLQARSHDKYDYLTAGKSWLEDIFVPKFNQKGPIKTTCKDNICSTIHSQAMADATNTRAHPHKAPNRTLPADLLRSKSNFDVVGATDKYRSVLKNRPLVRGLFRGGLGLGMAGTAYGAIKGIQHVLNRNVYNQEELPPT